VLRVIVARDRTARPGDPWWVYNMWQSRDSASLLRELCQSIGPGGRP
jgi:hypothetical protein